MQRIGYAQDLADTPGAGKLHHHLGLFVESREGWRRTMSCLSFRQEVKKFQSYYYIFYSELFFYFSLTTLHPFSTSRESVLPIWSTAAQRSRLSNPSTRAADLFVLLHGMLFTNIQLDDFPGTLARFLERLEMEGEGVEEREWVMMGIVNLGAVLEYGRASSVVRRAGGFGGVKDGTNVGGGSGVKAMV